MSVRECSVTEKAWRCDYCGHATSTRRQCACGSFLHMAHTHGCDVDEHDNLNALHRWDTCPSAHIHPHDGDGHIHTGDHS